MKRTKPIIVYFHGYGSSASTDKVERLRNMGYEVVAWTRPNDSDPTLSLNDLGCKIMDFLAGLGERPESCLFVGTSLGAWYAWSLGKEFGAKTLLINPCYDPTNMLKKFGINAHYDVLEPTHMDSVVIGEADEVIDFTDEFKKSCANLTLYPGVKHRFNGPEFEKAVKELIG